MPTLRLPVWLAYIAAGGCELALRALPPAWRFEPLLTRAEVLKTGVAHHFSIDKARRELGYRPEEYDPGEMVMWFLERGHGRRADTAGRRRWAPRLQLLLALLLACMAAVVAALVSAKRQRLVIN
jgi:hypothetical protein